VTQEQEWRWATSWSRRNACPADAGVVAALLAGVRFHLEVPEEERDRAHDDAAVWVLAAEHGSPAVNRRPVEVLRAHRARGHPCST
jgi:hypothetical protein